MAEHSSSSKEDIDMKPAMDNWTMDMAELLEFVEFLEGETEMVRRKERYIVTRSATCGVADFWKGKLKVEERFSQFGSLFH